MDELKYKDETGNRMLTQAQLCTLFGKSKATISKHIKHIFEEGELNPDAVVRKFRTTTQQGTQFRT